MLAYGMQEAVGEYLTAKFPALCSIAPYRPHAAIGFVNGEGVLVGGIGAHLVNGYDAEISIYLEPKSGFILDPCTVRQLCRQAFVDAGLVRVTAIVAKRNLRARKLLEGLGFKLEGIKRRGFDGRRHGAQYSMLAEDCAWLDNGHSKKGS